MECPHCGNEYLVDNGKQPVNDLTEMDKEMIAESEKYGDFLNITKVKNHTGIIFTGEVFGCPLCKILFME